MARNARVPAPCCGRRIPADMLMFAGDQPEALRPQRAHYVCAVCRETLFLRGQTTRAEFYGRALAAPAIVEKMRKLDQELRRGVE